MKRKPLIQIVALCALLLSTNSAFAVRQNGGSMSARDIIEANIKATGGLEAWRAVEDMHTNATISVDIPNMGKLELMLDSWSIFPGYGFTDVSLVSGPDAITAEAVNMKVYYTPLEGWMDNAQGRTDLKNIPAQQRRQFQRTSPKNGLEFINYPDSALVLLADTTFDERAVYAVSVTTEGIASTYFYDKETLLVLAQETVTPVGNATVVMGEYMDVDGLLFASGQTVDSGQGTQVIKFSKIEINTGFSARSLALKSGALKRSTPQ